MHTYKGGCPLTLFPPLNFQNLNVLLTYLRVRVSDQGQRELQKMWLPEKENLEELQVIQNPTEIKKMSPSQILSTTSQTLCLLTSTAERGLFWYLRGAGSLCGALGLHWYLQTSAGHLGVGEGSPAPGMRLPKPEALSGLGEFPLWMLLLFLGNTCMCGQGRAREVNCLEPAHSASCSSADDELWVSFATAQDGVSAKTQGCVSF